MKTSEDPVRILRKVRRVLGDPKLWAQGHYACDASGVECDANDPKAARWCVVGGVYRAGRVKNGAGGYLGNVTWAQRQAFDALAVATPEPWTSAQYNDRHTHEEVMAVLDDAIALLTEGR
jgi:hypothetical protein